MKKMLWVIFIMAIGTTFPTPIFPLFQEQYNLSNLGITSLFAIYAVFLIPFLLIAGPLSNNYGLKRINMIGVIISLVSIILFLIGTSSWHLYFSRILEGIGFGLFMGTATTLLLKQVSIEMAPKTLTLSSIGVMFGFGMGPAISGLAIQYIHFQQLRLPFLVLILLLISALVSLIAVHDQQVRPYKKEKIKINMSVPKNIRFIFWSFIASTGFIVFSLNGIIISLIPTYVKSVLGTDNLSISGLLILLLLGGGGFSQQIPLFQSLIIRIRVGISLQLIGAWIMIISGSTESISLLCIGIFIQAIGGGWSFQASLQLAGVVPHSEDRPKVISTYYSIAYAGFIVPIIGVGVLNSFFELTKSLTILNLIITFIVIFIIIVSFKFNKLKVGYFTNK